MNWKGVSPVGWLTKGILSVLVPSEIANPAVLLVVALCLQETANFLVFTFSLAIGLWMVSRREADQDPQQLEKGFADT